MTGPIEPTPDEFPAAGEIIKIVVGDIDSSRALLQRLLAVSDALLVVTFTVLTVLAGLALANDAPAVALLGVPLVLSFGYLDALHWVHFRRISGRIRVLERLVDSYVITLRERGVARPQALKHFVGAVDRYQFGVERALEPPTRDDIWNVNRTRLRLLPYLLVATALLGAALIAS